MSTIQNTPSHYTQPDISFIVPCYNEEGIIEYTIPRLLAAFKKAGCRLQLVALDNGSSDRTGEIINEMAAKSTSVIYHRVEKNEGYGKGVLSVIPLCTAPLIGIIPADGQVDAEDVVLLYEAAVAAKGQVLAKVRRRFRMDGALRKVISFVYNLVVRILWPRLESFDVNGSPKILPREVLKAMRLKSNGWFLDPEIMIKAHYMGIRVVELNVFARMRASGFSHVRIVGASWELFWKLLAFRFSREVYVGRRELKKNMPKAKESAAS